MHKSSPDIKNSIDGALVVYTLIQSRRWHVLVEILTVENITIQILQVKLKGSIRFWT